MQVRCEIPGITTWAAFGILDADISQGEEGTLHPDVTASDIRPLCELFVRRISDASSSTRGI
eukprot:6270800-Amphidinium_carterae.1